MPRVRCVRGNDIVFLQEGGTAGRCGERTERCQWQKKRSERVAAVKILSVRRKAAQKFWAPQQDHRPLRKRYKECVRHRAGGEIGEALPVADEASRFRGSAPIGGHNSGRESAGTTMGKRTPPLRSVTRSAMGGRPQGSPLRRGYKECDAGRNPPVTAAPCQPPLGKGAKGTGMRIATGAVRPRNDKSLHIYRRCGERAAV